MTATALGTLTVGRDDDLQTVWSRIRALAAAGGLAPLDAARLALAAVDLIGRPRARAVVELTAVTGADSLRVEAAVGGGTGRCADLPDRLVDNCQPPAASGQSAEVTVVSVGRHPSAETARPGYTRPRQSTRRGGDMRALLATALVTTDEQAEQLAEFRAEIGQLRAELDATSQGLQALQAELSAQREQLEQARAAAVHTSEAKAAFLANMSHEIRSPLNAVTGFTSLLKETPLSPEQAEYAEALTTAGVHLQSLIDGIVDLSKIESGHFDLEEVPFDLITCVEDAAGIVAPHAEEKGLALAALFAPGTPGTVVGDPVRLRQILVNLLSNAVKFTTRGQVTVEVAALPGDGQRCELVFDVHDTGTGIPAEAVGLLFDPFSQADTSATRRYGGTELGLSISRQLAERMGGGITVESALGEGSTFTATVTLRRGGPARRDGRPDQPLSGTQVLVVHPERVVAEAIRQHLAAWGARTIVAASAADAVSRSTEWADAALAVVSIGHPLSDPPGAIQILTAARGDRPLPMVAVTPLTSPRRPTRRHAAAWAVTAMPIRRARLRAAVLGALGRTEPPRPAVPISHNAVPIGRGVVPTGRGAVPTGRGGGQPPALHVLVAEDDPASQRILTLLLDRLGYQADVARDGEQAVIAITTGDYDLVFMDVLLPGLDGIGATRKARSQRPGQRPRIIAVTANVTPGTRESCLHAGMNGFLTKPVQLDDLARVITDTTHQPAPQPTPAQRR